MKDLRLIVCFAIKNLYENSIDLSELENYKVININPTFTAHPTEKKKKSLIDKQRRVLALIEEFLDDNINQKRRQRARRNIKAGKLILGTDDKK